MHNLSSGGPTWSVSLLRDDMKSLGWLPIDLARQAGVSHMTVGRFFSGERQTARSAKKLAKALGHDVERYLIRSTAFAATALEPAEPRPRTVSDDQQALPFARAAVGR